MNRCIVFGLTVLVTVCSVSPASADVATYAIRETAEFVMKKFGREAAEQGVDVLSKKIGSLASRYGDSALAAFSKVGPRVSHLADNAGQHADLAVKLLAGHGDDAVRLVSKPSQLGLVARLGDDAAESLVKHGDIAEPLLETCGEPAIRALRQMTPQNGRRVAMMLADGELTKLGRAQEILDVIGRYGDSAADFVWRHKGSLAVGAALTAFLSSPDAFIDGGIQLTSIATDAVVEPVVAEVAQSTPWSAIISLGMLFGSVVLGLKLWSWGWLPSLRLSSKNKNASALYDETSKPEGGQ